MGRFPAENHALRRAYPPYCDKLEFIHRHLLPVGILWASSAGASSAGASAADWHPQGETYAAVHVQVSTDTECRSNLSRTSLKACKPHDKGGSGRAAEFGVTALSKSSTVPYVHGNSYMPSLGQAQRHLRRSTARGRSVVGTHPKARKAPQLKPRCSRPGYSRCWILTDLRLQCLSGSFRANIRHVAHC